MHDYLAWPPAELDPHRLAAQAQVIHVVVLMGTKAGFEAHRERARTAAPAELAAKLTAAGLDLDRAERPNRRNRLTRENRGARSGAAKIWGCRRNRCVRDVRIFRQDGGELRH